MLFVFVLLTVAIALYFYYFLWKPQLYWKRKNVKQGPPIPLLGDTFTVVFKQEAGVEMVRNIYKRFKDVRYCGLYQLTTPALMLRDPDLIKQIMVKDFDYFVDHRNFTTIDLDPLWSGMLFFLKGDSWKQMRHMLTPSFTGTKMRAMYPLMETSALQYVDFYMQQNKNVVNIEFKDSCSRFANDVIANCAFGIQVDSLKEPRNEFYMNGKEIAGFHSKYSKLIFYWLAPKIMKFLNIRLFGSHITSFLTSIVRDCIQIREEQNIVRPDLINLLMEGRLRYKKSTVEEDVKQIRKMEISENVMAAQAMLFFFAGFDSVSTVMSFVCYELAVNPDIQERLRQEVDETYEENGNKTSYDIIINQLKYMEMIINETMRKYSPVPFIDRVCAKPYTIQPERPDESPVHLKPGDVIWIPIPGLHYDEKYFANPNKFDPERFSAENKGNIKPYTYIPFGSGPRNCIGGRFAMMEAKTLIFHILLKFELIVIEKTPIPIVFNRKSVSTSIKGGCWVGMKRRENPTEL